MLSRELMHELQHRGRTRPLVAPALLACHRQHIIVCRAGILRHDEASRPGEGRHMYIVAILAPRDSAST